MRFFIVDSDEAIHVFRLLRSLRSLAMTFVLLFLFPFSSFAMKFQAPEIPSGLDWLNTDKPLTLAGLRGKFVLLDFWTYCCINCQHIIPDLKKLEAKYPNELVVIGVHSAKFRAEGITDNIRAAILRHGIEHPVVNDPELSIWQMYQINSWPTVVLIDPQGNVLSRKGGEGIFEPIDAALQKSIPVFNDQLNRTPLTWALEKNKKTPSLLDFPGKITADSSTGRLFISDSGHNQILITSLDGVIQNTIGSGRQGRSDGDFNTAEFFHPQGLVYANNYLYIADTENHLIRRVDLINKTVHTIAGNGQQGFDRNPNGLAVQTALSSPWDLTIVEGVLYIAMAGTHQIWALDLNRGTIKAHAGSGYENITDGDFNRSALAQTSGISSDGQKLYFADSETSSVRMADTTANGQVKTIIGFGLFEFGDRDGDKDTARFQHPMGILYHDGVLLVADTYNNKIKLVDPQNRNARTFAGDGQAGLKNGLLAQAQFNEPGGIAAVQGKFYVADTNNHKIRVLDPASGTVDTLNIRKAKTAKPLDLAKFTGQRITLNPHGSRIEDIVFDLEFPAEHELLKESDPYIRILTADGNIILESPINGTHLRIKLNEQIDAQKIYVDAVVYYCRHGKGTMCLFKNILFEVPLTPTQQPEDLNITYSVQ